MKVFNECDLKDEDKKTFLNISWGCVCAFIQVAYFGNQERGFRYYNAVKNNIEDGYPLYHEQFYFAKQLSNYYNSNQAESTEEVVNLLKDTENLKTLMICVTINCLTKYCFLAKKGEEK